MWRSLQRLVLGGVLIAAASAVLLFTDTSRADRHRGDGGVRQYTIDLLVYVLVHDVEEVQKGIRQGFTEAGWVEGRHYKLRLRNAQGDMPTLSALADAALTEGTDMVMTMSTPTLQAALQRVKTVPVVFTFCASGIAAGAGTTDEDHLANVTGVQSASPADELIATIRELLPGVASVGTLVVPSEANSVFNVERLTNVAKEKGIEVVRVPVNTITEVSDAAVALAGRDIDAILQIASNLTTSSFVSLSKAADDANLPLLSNLSGDLEQGAAVVQARDWYDGGVMAAHLAVRVLSGEDPAKIPFQSVTATKLMVNLDAARAQEIEVPQALIDRADKVIGAATQ